MGVISSFMLPLAIKYIVKFQLLPLQPFERGNLDAGRLSWLFGREVLAAEDPFDPESYDSLLVIDEARARASFPDAFDGTWVA